MELHRELSYGQPNGRRAILALFFSQCDFADKPIGIVLVGPKAPNL